MTFILDIWNPNYAFSSTDNALMNMKIYAYPEHQSQLQIDVAQIESKVVQIEDLNSDFNRLSSPSPNIDKKKKKTASVSKISSSNTNRKASKKQPVILAPKTAWSQVIAINKFKLQQKYTPITMSVNLNKFLANWDLKQRKKWERFQVVLIEVPASTTTATLYLDNPTHSIFTPTGCKAFKLIQDRSTCKLITYYELWVNLDKVIGKAFSLGEFTSDWKRYYTLNLKQRRSYHQKVKQNDDSKISQKNTNTIKLDKKHKETKRAKKIDKSLDGIDKLTVLADIKLMLRKLEVF
ncbi:unnamed protein product [Rhizophagus irregularis]|nr:unnamed protein product [Rhizophagus irregularis]